MKNRGLAYVMGIALSGSLFVGGTYALLTSEDDVNIAVGTGKVEVVATLENLALHSPKGINKEGVVTDNTNVATATAFANGGTAELTGDSLVITNMTPGDEATFDIRVENNSTVTIQYRTLLSVTEDNGLFDALDVTIGDYVNYDGTIAYTEWATLKAGSEDEVLECSVVLPAAETEAYGLNCVMTFKVEAAQGNMVDQVAAIGETKYETFEEAISAAQSGDVVEVLSDLPVEMPATVADGVTVKNALFTKPVGVTAVSEVATVGEEEVAPVVFDGCTFTGKALVFADGRNVTIKNCTFIDTTPGNGAYVKNAGVPYRYEVSNGATVTEENNTTVLNVYAAADLWEITNVSNRVTEDGQVDKDNVPRYQFEGVTINILSDIDLENAEWRPICQYPDHPGFKGTINGNGHTIYNLNCYGMNGSTSVEQNSLRHCQGFIGYAASGAVIKDLKFVDANVFSANSICGVVVANSLGGVTIDNCHVDGAVMESNYYIAGICGKLGDGDKVTNCSVKNLTVKSWYQNQPELYSGAIYGTISNGTPEVTDCTWENVVVQYVADTDKDGVKEVITSVDATH